MNFRHLPFQFTTVNPSERQAEIRKRFGLSNPPSDMIIDFGNSSNMGAGNRESNSATSSPRLQHRVPVFMEDPDPWISEKSRSNNVDNGKKPNVRVIPIEYEGDRKPARQRTFSGPAGIQQNGSIPDGHVESDIKPAKHSMSNMTLPNRKRVPSGETKPRVYNIPIQIEKRESSNEPFKKPNLNKSPPKELKTNGCTVTKVSSDNKLQKSEEKIPEPGFKLQLKKVDDILGDLKSYASEVESFSGTVNDKQYRYLDEMLTRLMIRLDDIETMGNSEVRNARKAAIKQVQSYIDLLDTKINSESKEKEAESAVCVENQDLSGDIEDGKLDAENMPEATTEHVEQQEVPEIEMVEATVTEEIECNKADLNHQETKRTPEIEMGEAAINEPQEIIECNKTDMDETKEVPEIEMVEASITALEKINSCDEADAGKQEDNSLSPIEDVIAGSKIGEVEMKGQTESCKDINENHSTERGASESHPEVEMASICNLELTKSCDEEGQVTDNTTELKDSPSLETSTDIDMVESPENSQDSRYKNEPCVQNFGANCDIEMSDCSVQSIEKNSETMLDCCDNIPENASSHSDMKDEGSIVTTSNQNSELSKLDQADSAGENNA